MTGNQRLVNMILFRFSLTLGVTREQAGAGLAGYGCWTFETADPKLSPGTVPTPREVLLSTVCRFRAFPRGL